jgi:hypothetical protein
MEDQRSVFEEGIRNLRRRVEDEKATSVEEKDRVRSAEIDARMDIDDQKNRLLWVEYTSAFLSGRMGPNVGDPTVGEGGNVGPPYRESFFMHSVIVATVTGCIHKEKWAFRYID